MSKSVLFLFVLLTFVSNLCGQKRIDFDMEKHLKCTLLKRTPTRMKHRAQSILRNYDKTNFNNKINKSRNILLQAIEIKKKQKELSCGFSRWDTLEIIECYLWMDDFKNAKLLLKKLKRPFSSIYFNHYLTINKRESKYEVLCRKPVLGNQYGCGTMSDSEREGYKLNKAVRDCKFIYSQKDYILLVDYLNSIPLKLNWNSGGGYWKVLNQFYIRGLIESYSIEDIVREFENNPIIIMEYDRLDSIVYDKSQIVPYKLKIFTSKLGIDDDSKPRIKNLNKEDHLNYLTKLPMYRKLKSLENKRNN